MGLVWKLISSCTCMSHLLDYLQAISVVPDLLLFRPEEVQSKDTSLCEEDSVSIFSEAFRSLNFHHPFGPMVQFLHPLRLVVTCCNTVFTEPRGWCLRAGRLRQAGALPGSVPLCGRDEEWASQLQGFLCQKSKKERPLAGKQCLTMPTICSAQTVCL